MNFWQRTRLLLVVLILGATVWLGHQGGRDSLHASQNSVEVVAAVLQILYSVAALVCLVALVWRPLWARPALFAWGATLTLTGGLSPVVWGGAPWWIGVLGGVVTLLVAGLVAWGMMAHLRMRGLR